MIWPVSGCLLFLSLTDSNMDQVYASRVPTCSQVTLGSRLVQVLALPLNASVSLNKPFSLKASVSPPLGDETKRVGVRELSAPGPQAHRYLLRPQFSASDVQAGLQQVFPILYKNKTTCT